jgi:serine/threonine-protein kinase
MPSDPATPERVVGRYALFGAIARGGMATVHLGRLIGPAGFHRVVAVKRMLPRLAADRDFSRMFLHEARLTTRVRHPNVVSATDVVSEGGELFLVMDYVESASLVSLLEGAAARGRGLPLPVATGIAIHALLGLHAAHEARSEAGEPLGLVHRDVSPQNILCGTDGLARVVDFGVAKALGAEPTRGGVLKGKAPYMSPEQVRHEPIDRRADIHALSVVLWEALTGRRLFSADTSTRTLDQVLRADARLPPSRRRAEIPPALDAVVLRGLALARDERFATALDMATALEEISGAPSPRAIAAAVRELSGPELDARAALVRACEAADLASLGGGASLHDTATDLPEAPVRSTPRSAPPFDPRADAPPLLEETRDLVRPTRGPLAEVAGAAIAPQAELRPPGPIEETREIVRPIVEAPVAASPDQTASAREGSIPESRASRAPAGELLATRMGEPVEPLPPADDPGSARGASGRRAVVVFVLALGATTLVAGLVAAATTLHRPPSPSPSAALTAPSSTADRPRGAPSSDRAEPPREAIASAPSGPSPSGETAPSADAPAVEPTSSSSSTPDATASASRPTARPPRAQCSPPYYYEGGLKRFKPGCL